MHNKWMCTRRKGANLRPSFATRGGQFPLNVKLPAAAFSSLRSFLSCSNTHSLCVHTRNHNRREHLQLIYSICYNSANGGRESAKNENVPAGFQVSRAAPEPWDRPCETLSPTPLGRCPLGTRTRRRRPNSPAIFLARNHLRTHTIDIQLVEINFSINIHVSYLDEKVFQKLLFLIMWCDRHIRSLQRIFSLKLFRKKESFYSARH